MSYATPMQGWFGAAVSAVDLGYATPRVCWTQEACPPTPLRVDPYLMNVGLSPVGSPDLYAAGPVCAYGLGPVSCGVTPPSTQAAPIDSDVIVIPDDEEEYALFMLEARATRLMLDPRGSAQVTLQDQMLAHDRLFSVNAYAPGSELNPFVLN